MLAWFQIALLVASVWYLIYTQAHTTRWAAIMGAVLLFLSVFPVLSISFIVLLWLFYLLAVLFFKFPEQRYQYFSRPLLNKFRKLLPQMSETEKIALEAGDVWWEGDLFCGRPDWRKLLNLSAPQLTSDEQTFLNKQTETLCAMINDWEIINQRDMPKEIWDYLKKEKFFGLVIDKKYGGLGFSSYAQSVIVAKVATRSLSVAVNIMVPNSLGPAELIAWFGTEEQKNHYLPRMAVGEEMPCFALTGLEAGSDAGGMKDHGIICRGTFDGREILGIRLNWEKRYITLSSISTLLGLAFKLYDPDHLLGEQEDIGITICLVPTKLPGVEIGKRHFPVSLAFLNGPTRGKDVFVPLEYVIGGKEMCGRGWHILMEALSAGRGISLPALSTAVAKSCFRTTSAYVNVRKQFNQPIGNFEGVALKLAEIAGLNYLVEAARSLTLTPIDQGIKPSLATAITKYHTTEMARIIINDAMDIHAGRGIQMGPRNYLAAMYFGIPICITVEGANILTRNLIVFGQGAVRCHPFIRKEIAALSTTDNKEAATLFDKLFLEHFSYAASNFARTLFYGLTGGIFIRSPIDNKLAKYYKQLTRMSAALAITSDLAMLTLGGDLKRREALSARLGDVLSYLYLGSAVLKYGNDHIQRPGEIEAMQWCLNYCLEQIQAAFKDFFRNFPYRILAKILSFIIFPWGGRYKKASDKLSFKLAKQMISNSTFRDRLSENCYINYKPDDVTGRLEAVYAKLITTEPLFIKLQQAIKNGTIKKTSDFETQLLLAHDANILSAEEIKLLKEFEAMRLDALLVDEFNASTLAIKA